MQPIPSKTQTTTNTAAWPWLLAGAAMLLLQLQAGCQLAGMAAALGTPTESETKSTAEYNLARQKDRKILVLVDQPSYLPTRINLRYFASDSIDKMLQQRAKMRADLFIGYDKLAEFRSNTSDFSMLAPEQVGAALGADIVLLVVITDFQLAEAGDLGYYSGSLDARAMLIDAATGEKLWPALEQARLVQVGFESERRGQDAAAVRLAVATAHCITRYLYNCPATQFRIPDERTAIGWEK